MSASMKVMGRPAARMKWAWWSMAAERSMPMTRVPPWAWRTEWVPVPQARSMRVLGASDVGRGFGGAG